MTNTKQRTRAKVTPIATAAVTLEPPDDWKPNGEHGYMATDTTPAGRLVRLADVVMWLMDRRSLPCRAAVEQVCTAVESAAPNALYLVRPGDFALPVTSTHCFNAVTTQTIRSFWEAEPERVANDCGVSGALSYMRSMWGDSATPGEGGHYGQWVLDPLAIHLNKAAELWRYGTAARPIDGTVQPSTWHELVDHRKQRPGEAWTPEMLELLAAEKAARGSGAAASIAGELSISVSALNEALRRHRKRSPASPAGRRFA